MTSTPQTHPLAGKLAPASLLVDLPKLITAYYSERPDPAVAAQRVAFGTSGAATRVAADAGDSAADVGGVSGGVHQKRRNPRGRGVGV